MTVSAVAVEAPVPPPPLAAAPGVAAPLEIESFLGEVTLSDRLKMARERKLPPVRVKDARFAEDGAAAEDEEESDSRGVES